MAIYMVERYLPGTSAQRLLDASARVQAATDHMRAQGVPVRYLGSTFVPDDESCFCLFSGPSPRAVREANERARFPFARILDAVRIATDSKPTP